MLLPRSALRWLAVFVTALFLSGCFTLRYNVDDIYGSTPRANRTVAKVSSFKVEVRHHYLAWGLLSLGDPAEIEKAISAEVRRARGTGVRNVRVKHERGIIDVLLQSILGFTTYLSTTTVIEGEVVR
jgi:hypothetical protein